MRYRRRVGGAAASATEKQQKRKRERVKRKAKRQRQQALADEPAASVTSAPAASATNAITDGDVAQGNSHAEADTIADADEDETAADAEADGEDADAEADDEEDPAASGSAAENTTGSSAAKADPAAVTAPVKVGGCGCRRSTAFEPPLTLQFLLGANLDSYRRSGSGTKRRPSTYS